ncbi:MAG: redox-regulated ATPase YchF [Bacteroidetes bacterium SB0662_bin_6]|nr:redox-regulated ATPase YchF [Bacteroidetes bacterium SB0668_bin_1]MYE04042.1 redox-regulated ATPase YchF [Bacteroidetes bacterium SB0662_bin_6]
MALRCGITGLPNVGKSSLFNVLSGAGARSENYPFCTIEPNVGIAPVPDERLYRLAELSGSDKATPATVEYVDIAGLVAGASKGEGLGNRFLAHIREVDAIVHVARCFEDPDVTHVTGTVDPARDIGIIETELLLKDLESLERRIEKVAKQAKGGDRTLRDELAFVEKVHAYVGDGKAARTFPVQPGDEDRLDALFLLSAKPVLYVANVAEDDLPDGGPHAEAVREIASAEGFSCVVVCAELEAQLASLGDQERAAWLEELGLEAPGMDRFVAAGYELLNLITFFTTGPKETRACTVVRGARAPAAGGVVHSDFEKGFIRAETIRYEDLMRYGSETAAREAGAMRAEGREYVVADGDVILFRFNV